MDYKDFFRYLNHGSIKSAISLLFDNTLVAPFRTSSPAPSTSIFIQLTLPCLISLESKILSKVSAFTSKYFSELIDLPEITVLYIVFFNPSIGKKA